MVRRVVGTGELPSWGDSEEVYLSAVVRLSIEASFFDSAQDLFSRNTHTRVFLHFFLAPSAGNANVKLASFIPS
jgi:hypothetical protein